MRGVHYVLMDNEPRLRVWFLNESSGQMTWEIKHDKNLNFLLGCQKICIRNDGSWTLHYKNYFGHSNQNALTTIRKVTRNTLHGDIAMTIIKREMGRGGESDRSTELFLRLAAILYGPVDAILIDEVDSANDDSTPTALLPPRERRQRWPRAEGAVAAATRGWRNSGVDVWKEGETAGEIANERLIARLSSRAARARGAHEEPSARRRPTHAWREGAARELAGAQRPGDGGACSGRETEARRQRRALGEVEAGLRRPGGGSAHAQGGRWRPTRRESALTAQAWREGTVRELVGARRPSGGGARAWEAEAGARRPDDGDSCARGGGGRPSSFSPLARGARSSNLGALDTVRPGCPQHRPPPPPLHLLGTAHHQHPHPAILLPSSIPPWPPPCTTRPTPRERRLRKRLLQAVLDTSPSFKLSIAFASPQSSRPRRLWDPTGVIIVAAPF
uniref:Uncharacterized protein n=1 Tax=Oryza punctata TaxID=4537 RepID=A0A0E0KHE1_ORYPU